MKKVLLILALLNALFFSFLAPTTLVAQGKVVLIPLIHHGAPTAREAIDSMKANNVRFACLEVITPALQAYCLGDRVWELDSFPQQKTTRYDSIKKTEVYKKEVLAIQNAFRLFAEPVGKDTGSTAFVKAIGLGTKEVWGNRKRIYIDGYDKQTSKRVAEVNFWYEKVLRETDSTRRQRLIEKTLKAFYLFNLSREKGMVKCIKRKVAQGEIVGFPVGLLHRDGLERLLKNERIPFETVTSFMAKSTLSEDDLRMGDACHFPKLTKGQKKILFEYAQKKWVPEVK